MVDVGRKPSTRRMATAVGRIALEPATIQKIRQGAILKGDVLAAARLAAVMGAKRTWEVIPLCHPLPLTGITVRIDEENGSSAKRATGDSRVLRITVSVRSEAKTGVEMEALTGVCAALLTIYDMCKRIDKTMAIGGIGLIRKRGGRSGDVHRSPMEAYRAMP